MFLALLGQAGQEVDAGGLHGGGRLGLAGRALHRLVTGPRAISSAFLQGKRTTLLKPNVIEAIF